MNLEVCLTRVIEYLQENERNWHLARLRLVSRETRSKIEKYKNFVLPLRCIYHLRREFLRHRFSSLEIPREPIRFIEAPVVLPVSLRVIPGDRTIRMAVNQRLCITNSQIDSELREASTNLRNIVALMYSPSRNRIFTDEAVRHLLDVLREIGAPQRLILRDIQTTDDVGFTCLVKCLLKLAVLGADTLQELELDFNVGIKDDERTYNRRVIQGSSPQDQCEEVKKLLENLPLQHKFRKMTNFTFGDSSWSAFRVEYYEFARWLLRTFASVLPTTLKGLHFLSPTFSRDGVDELIETLKRFPALTELTISVGGLTQAQATSLKSSLETMTNLNRLKIEYFCKRGGKDFAYREPAFLQHMVPLSTLRALEVLEINIEGCWLFGTFLEQLAHALLSLQYLTDLRVTEKQRSCWIPRCWKNRPGRTHSFAEQAKSELPEAPSRLDLGEAIRACGKLTKFQWNVKGLSFGDGVGGPKPWPPRNPSRPTTPTGSGTLDYFPEIYAGLPATIQDIKIGDQALYDDRYLQRLIVPTFNFRFKEFSNLRCLSLNHCEGNPDDLLDALQEIPNKRGMSWFEITDFRTKDYLRPAHSPPRNPGSRFMQILCLIKEMPNLLGLVLIGGVGYHGLGEAYQDLCSPVLTSREHEFDRVFYTSKAIGKRELNLSDDPSGSNGGVSGGNLEEVVGGEGVETVGGVQVPGGGVHMPGGDSESDGGGGGVLDLSGETVTVLPPRIQLKSTTVEALSELRDGLDLYSVLRSLKKLKKLGFGLKSYPCADEFVFLYGLYRARQRGEIRDPADFLPGLEHLEVNGVNKSFWFDHIQAMSQLRVLRIDNLEVSQVPAYVASGIMTDLNLAGKEHLQRFCFDVTKHPFERVQRLAIEAAMELERSLPHTTVTAHWNKIHDETKEDLFYFSNSFKY
jgi:hypothetical protein